MNSTPRLEMVWPEVLRTRLPAVRPGPGYALRTFETGDQIVASARALRSQAFEGGGELGWVAGDPAHAGYGLGHLVSAAAAGSNGVGGCRPVHLYTEDFRLAALKTYLGLGYEPVLAGAGASQRWRAVCSAVGWPFTPERWRGWSEHAV